VVKGGNMEKSFIYNNRLLTKTKGLYTPFTLEPLVAGSLVVDAFWHEV